ncbi:MAG: A/G-specific adenine glycosylase [Clostridia bacterium]|nr:A/G-specific adenine glycosylase [Clostridia bacterium]
MRSRRIFVSHWNQLTEPLLRWYNANARVLPWRDDPTPYHVWISEIMLQQTRVVAAIPYYHRFLSELPTLQDLAACPEERLLKLWEGLGYYSRVRNLKKAAEKIVAEHGGEFPSDYASVRALPGIGDYTAGAILSIAFGKPEPAVDGNVLRVVSRVTGDPSDIMADDTRKRCRDLLRGAMPAGRTSAYTQALMELGATVCLPNGAPLCDSCPARDLCVALRDGLIEDLPVKTPPKPRRIEQRTVLFLFRCGKVAIRRRPKKGLLSGLWEYPNDPSEAFVLPDGVTILSETFGAAKHVFSHVEWHMTSVLADAASDALPEGYVWVTAEELSGTYALPAAFRAYTPQVLEYLTRSL